MAPTCSERKEATMSPGVINQHRNPTKHTTVDAGMNKAEHYKGAHIPEQLSNDEITDSESRSISAGIAENKNRTQARKHRAVTPERENETRHRRA